MKIQGRKFKWCEYRIQWPLNTSPLSLQFNKKFACHVWTCNLQEVKTLCSRIVWYKLYTINKFSNIWNKMLVNSPLCFRILHFVKFWPYFCFPKQHEWKEYFFVWLSESNVIHLQVPKNLKGNLLLPQNNGINATLKNKIQIWTCDLQWSCVHLINWNTIIYLASCTYTYKHLN